MAEEGDCRSVVEAAASVLGGLDVLCNIAGILRPGHTVEQDSALFDQTVAVNLAGTYYMCRAALPHLLDGGGAIVNMASAAALQGVPDELYEAARIDGASNWDMFKAIIVPLLQPTVLIILLLRLAEALKLFDIPFALTGGGPGIATQSYSFLDFRVGLRYFDLGYASAMAYGLLIVVMIIVTLFFRRLRQSYD